MVDKEPKLVEYTQIKEIDGLATLNGIIRNTNKVSQQFLDEVKNPIYQKKMELLNSCGLSEVPWAHIKHVFLGSVL